MIDSILSYFSISQRIIVYECVCIWTINDIEFFDYLEYNRLGTKTHAALQFAIKPDNHLGNLRLSIRPVSLVKREISFVW